MPKQKNINQSYEDENSGPISVYAELSKKQFHLIQNGEVELEIPFGTVMKNKRGSRALRFICDNRRIAKELEEGLDDSYISWQEEDVNENV